MAITKAQIRALESIKECTGDDGWATHWGIDVQGRVLNRLTQMGLLQYSVRLMKGLTTLPWAAYRLTDAGREALGGPK